MKRLKTLLKLFLLRSIYSSHLLHVISSGRIRPAILRFCGAKVGKNVCMGPFIYWDNHLELLEIGDNVIISPQACFLFHKRDILTFNIGDKYLDKPHVYKPIILKQNCTIGTRALILPGVTIGEGAAVGAGAIVTKDVPDWSIVTGSPAKVIKQFAPLSVSKNEL